MLNVLTANRINSYQELLGEHRTHLVPVSRLLRQRTGKHWLQRGGQVGS